MIINTLPSTRLQPINVAQNAALQLPAGHKASEYYAGEIQNPASAFYRVAISLAQLSLQNAVINVISTDAEIGKHIRLAISALAQALMLARTRPGSTPSPALLGAVAQTPAEYVTAAPPPPSSDIPLPSPGPAAPRYTMPKPFAGEGVDLGRGYFAEMCENGSANVWYGTGALRPLVNVPDIDTAHRFVDATCRHAAGRMVDKHFVPDDAFLAAVDAAIGALAAPKPN